MICKEKPWHWVPSRAKSVIRTSGAWRLNCLSLFVEKMSLFELRYEFFAPDSSANGV